MENHSFPQVELDISLDDVHFAYEKDREILKGITMNFPANSFISFVGESGCGKSTLAGIFNSEKSWIFWKCQGGWCGYLTDSGRRIDGTYDKDHT